MPTSNMSAALSLVPALLLALGHAELDYRAKLDAYRSRHPNYTPFHSNPSDSDWCATVGPAIDLCNKLQRDMVACAMAAATIARAMERVTDVDDLAPVGA